MSVVHHLRLHHHHAKPLPGELSARTFLAGLAALVALVALLGALAGVATWALARVFTTALS